MSLSRRTVLASTASLAASSLVQAAPSTQQPPQLFGSVQDGKVTLPPLHAASEGGEAIDNPRPPGKRLGVAVVGIGHLTLEQIMPAFGEAQAVRCTALVSGHRAKALAVAAQHGVPESSIYDYAGFDAIRNNPDVQIVYIVLPNGLHAEFTARAAAAGKHVLCEKPMATSVAEAEGMVKACRDARRKLMIAYRMQYDSTHRALIRMVRDKVYGDLRMIEAVNAQNDDAIGQWRQIKALSGGGSLPDVGLYCLNAFRYITGEEPVEVTGQVTRPKDDPRFREVEDLATFTLRFPSGVFAVGSSGYSAHNSRRLRAMASNGWIGLDPAFAYNNLVLEIGRSVEGADAREQRVFAPKNQFAVEMDHFAEAILADREPHTPGEEGLQDQRLIAAIYEAAAGGGVVKLPDIQKRDAFRGPFGP